MLLFAQLKELRNSVYKVAVWSRAAVLLNITEIAIRYFKIFCSVSQILFEFLSSCADKSSESHDGLPPVSKDVRSIANILVLL